jgi:Nitronate monooxygenase
VIAVGYEVGGYLGRDDIGSMVLTPRILESVKIPVLASGGIADGRGLSAELALGAEGILEKDRKSVVNLMNHELKRYRFHSMLPSLDM